MNTFLAGLVVAVAIAIPARPAFAREARAPARQAAQQSAPALSGRVLHADLPVPGATVTAARPFDSAQARGERTIATTTDENGVFSFAALEPGAWKITVEMRGFATVARDITIPFGTPELAVTMAMRPYGETIDPRAPKPTWPAATSAPKPTESAQAEVEVPEILNGSVVNGAATRFAQPRAFGNNRPRQPRAYTGSVSAMLAHSHLNARPYAFGGSVSPAPDYGDAQLGVVFGGPLRIPRLLRNGPTTRLSYQHGVQHNANTVSALVPTSAERGGDLSGRTGVIRDPQTGLPFPGNVIPVARISPQAASLLTYYPLPTGQTSTGANFQRPVVGVTTSDTLQINMTKPLGTRSAINGTFGYQRSSTKSVNLFAFTDLSRQSTINAAVTANRRFFTRLNVSVNYQFTHTDNTATPFFANRVNVSGDAGITGNDQDPLNWGPPTIAFPDIADLRDGTYQRSSRTSHVIAGEVQYRRGRHSVTAGGDGRLHGLTLRTQPDPRGTLSFTGAATGHAFADFLLGMPTTSAIAFGNTRAHLNGGIYNAFVNDDFRVSAGLTLNVGVRWEYESPYTERDGRLANLDVSPGFAGVAPVLGTDGVGALTGAAYPRSLVRRDRGGFQPRLGFSWRPWLTSSLVIRGGYGLYRNLGVYQSIGTLLAQQPPFSNAFSVQTSAATPLTLANPFPASVPKATTFAVDPDFATAVLHSWQVSVQRDFPASLTAVAAYFGNRGTELAQAFLPNTYPAGAQNPCAGACPSGFVYLTSGGSSSRHAGQFTLRRRLHAGLTATVNYTIAKAVDNAATLSNTSMAPSSLAVAQNWLDLDAERGPSAFDQRHLLAVEVQYTTGVGIMGGTLVDGWLGRLYKDWTVTAQFNAGSGLPLTPVFFSAVPGTGVVGVRPSLTGVPTAPTDEGSYANPAAFTAPAPGTWGNAGRNSIRGPGTSSFDMTLARAFRLPRRMTIEWRIAATNALNRVTFSTIDRIITSPQFGRPTAASQMRRIQTFLSFKF